MEGFVIISEELATELSKYFNMKESQILQGLEHNLYEKGSDEREDAQAEMKRIEDWLVFLNDPARRFTHKEIKRGMASIRIQDIKEKRFTRLRTR